jgi:hypothetical protein
VFGYLAKGATEFQKAQFTCARAVGDMDGSVDEDLNAVGCFVTATDYRCYFVGKMGRIARYYPLCHQYIGTLCTQFTTCYKHPSPTTNELTGVWAAVNPPADRLEVRIVGKGGYALRGVQALSFGFDPNFQTVGQDYSQFLPEVAGADLNALGGTGLDDLFLAGQRGILIQWQDTNHPPMANQVPFVKRPLGTTGTLNSLISIRNGVFASGPNRTLVYSGPLFMPTP